MLCEVKLKVVTLGASHSIESLLQTKEGGGIRLEAYFSQCTLRINFSALPLGRATFRARVCIDKESVLTFRVSDRCRQRAEANTKAVPNHPPTPQPGPLAAARLDSMVRRRKLVIILELSVLPFCVGPSKPRPLACPWTAREQS